MQGVVSMEESTTYQAILARGVASGSLAEAKKLLLLMGETRFGPPNAQAKTALDAISDLTRLETLGVRLLNVESWDELLKLPAKSRTKRRS
jgi:hypothetical protein